MQRLWRAFCKAQVTVLRGSLRTIRSDFSFERESNGWAKGAKAERGENEGSEGRTREAKGERGKRRENEGRRGEGAENERRAKLTKWEG